MAAINSLNSMVERIGKKWGLSAAETYEKLNSAKGKNDIASYVESTAREVLDDADFAEISKEVQERIKPGSTLREKVAAATQAPQVQPQASQPTATVPDVAPAPIPTAAPQAVPVGKPVRLALPEAPKGEVVPTSKTFPTPRAPEAPKQVSALAKINPELLDRIQNKKLTGDDLSTIRSSTAARNDFIDVVAEDIQSSPSIMAAAERFKALPAIGEKRLDTEAQEGRKALSSEFKSLSDTVQSEISKGKITEQQGTSFLRRIRAGVGIAAGTAAAAGAVVAAKSGKKDEESKSLKSLGEPEKVESAIPELAPTTAQPIRSAILSIPKVKKPEDIAILADKISAMSAELSPDRKAFYDEQRSRLDEQLKAIREEQVTALKEAKTEAEKREAEIRNKELAETLGHALVQLGAGMQGLRSGVDLSGIKFQKNDWQKEYDRSLRGLEEDRKLIQSTYMGQAEDTNKRVAALDKSQDKELALEERKTNDMRDLLVKDYMIRQNAFNTHLENQEKFKQALALANTKGDAGAERRLQAQADKEQNAFLAKTEKELKALEEAHATALNLANGDVTRKDRPKALETFKKALRNSGVSAEEADSIVKKADEAAWIGYDFKLMTNYTQGLIEHHQSRVEEIKEGKAKPFTAPPKAGKVTSGKQVKVIPPGRTEAVWIPEKDLQDALKEGAKLVKD